MGDMAEITPKWKSRKTDWFPEPKKPRYIPELKLSEDGALERDLFPRTDMDEQIRITILRAESETYDKKHKLGQWYVNGNAAANTCIRCNRGVAVSVTDKRRIRGAALVELCEHA